MVVTNNYFLQDVEKPRAKSLVFSHIRVNQLRFDLESIFAYFFTGFTREKSRKIPQIQLFSVLRKLISITLRGSSKLVFMLKCAVTTRMPSILPIK